MKFTHYLIRHLIPEWIKFYVNFKLLKTYLSIMTILKQFLLDVKQQKTKSEYKFIKSQMLNNPEMIKKLKQDIDNFTLILDEEVQKVIAFTFFKYKDLVSKFDKLCLQLKAMDSDYFNLNKFIVSLPFLFPWQRMSLNRQEQRQIQLIKQNKTQMDNFVFKQNQLKESFFRFYVEVQQLQSFIEVNGEASRKIYKKFKKQFLRGLNCQGNLDKLLEKQKQIQEIPKKLKFIKDQTESDIIKYFYQHDNPKKCREFLRSYTHLNKFPLVNIFSFGFFAGFTFVFILILLVMRYDGYIDPNSDKVFNSVFPCFRGTALFLIYYWILAFDVAGWNYFNINYKLFLGFNHHFSTLPQILSRLTILSSIFLVLFVLYCIQMESIGKLAEDLIIIDPRYLPLFMWIILLVYVFYPFKTMFNPEGRNWMYIMIYGSFWGYLFTLEPRFTFFIDQIPSLSTPIRDLNYSSCYYYHLILYGQEYECDLKNSIVTVLPSTLPFLVKCLHYVKRSYDRGQYYNTEDFWNFLKTLQAAQVGLFSFLGKQNHTYFIIWILSAIVSTIWQNWWDLKKDFLFFESNSKYKFLRNDLGYNSPNLYYGLAVGNFILRTTWVLSISPDACNYLGIKNELFVLLLGFFEMMRRFINNFLKMEKEHIINLRTLRTVQDLRMPFDIQSEMQVCYKDSPHWSVSSFQEPVSGFESFENDLVLDVQPNEVMITPQHGPQNISMLSRKSYLKPVQLSLDGDFQWLCQSILSDNKQPMIPKRETIHDLIKIYDQQIIEQAKQKEKLELQRIKSLKEDNKYFKKIIYDSYEKFKVFNK